MKNIFRLKKTMGKKYVIVLCLLIWIAVAEAQVEVKVFNVNDYGAISDENTHNDNTMAFLKAWNEACKWNGNATVLIPEGTYLLNPLVLIGTLCNGWMSFEINGILKSQPNSSSPTNNWIHFKHVNQLSVSGGGTLDGQGALAWKHNIQCRNKPNCQTLQMTTMRFDFITNGNINDLHSINSKTCHFVIFGCENITLTNLTLLAPKYSPNTDGIKISSTNGTIITNVKIGTGDDCVAMISGTSKVQISNLYCGPGHGISVGSLGKNDGEKDVQDIVVKNVTFNGTSNGIRIKTWASPLKKTLNAYDFVYEDIIMINVDQPINIDQEYCPFHSCYKKVASQVQIKNVTYRNIQGSGNSNIAISLKCSKDKPCENITVDNINLWRNGGKGKLRSFCSYVSGASYGNQIPLSCINPCSSSYLNVRK